MSSLTEITDHEGGIITFEITIVIISVASSTCESLSWW